MEDVKPVEDVQSVAEQQPVVGVQHAENAHNVSNLNKTPDVSIKNEAPPNKPQEELKAKASYKYEKEKTVDDVVAEADFIFADYRKRIKKFKSDEHLPPKYFDKLSPEQEYVLNKERDRLLKMYQERHKDFTKVYSFILRLMVQLGEYESAVFRRFLELIQKEPYKTEEEYFDRCSVYAKNIYRHYHPRASIPELKMVQERTEKMFKKEKEEFEKMAKEISDKIDETHNKAIEEKKKLIREKVLKFKE